jgi:hypothetical protein
MVGDPRITTAQAGILKMARQSEAARILHCPADDVRALIRAGQLRGRRGSRYPVYRTRSLKVSLAGAQEKLEEMECLAADDGPVLLGLPTINSSAHAEKSHLSG